MPELGELSSGNETGHFTRGLLGQEVPGEAKRGPYRANSGSGPQPGVSGEILDSLIINYDIYYLTATKLVQMNGTKLPGGPTQDEILALSLFKLGLLPSDTVLEIGCGTGKVSIAMAKQVTNVVSLDKRPDAVSLAEENVRAAGARNIGFCCTDALEYLKSDQVYDCAFLGGTQGLEEILPVLARKVRRTIVINAVMISTLGRAVAILKQLGLFTEVVHVQVSRSHDIAGSLMFKPIDPVYIIVARGAACS